MPVRNECDLLVSRVREEVPFRPLELWVHSQEIVHDDGRVVCSLMCKLHVIICSDSTQPEHSPGEADRASPSVQCLGGHSTSQSFLAFPKLTNRSKAVGCRVIDGLECDSASSIGDPVLDDGPGAPRCPK